jgi:hypothetical protein
MAIDPWMEAVSSIVSKPFDGWLRKPPSRIMRALAAVSEAVIELLRARFEAAHSSPTTSSSSRFI